MPRVDVCVKTIVRYSKPSSGVSARVLHGATSLVSLAAGKPSIHAGVNRGDSGAINTLFELQAEGHLDHSAWLLDSTMTRAQKSAAGAPAHPKKDLHEPEDLALGCARGG